MKPYDLSLLEEMDDQQQLLDLVGLFLTNTPLQIKELLQEAGKKNWEKVSIYAHKLKGSAGIFQADELLELVRQIERLSNQAKDAGVNEGTMDKLLQSLSPAYAKIEILLKEEQNK